MKIPFNNEFKDLDGKPIPEKPDEKIVDKDGQETIKKYPPFTLKTACVNVLLNTGLDQIICPQCRHQIRKPEELTGEEKARRFMLATKIYQGIELVDIGTKDIELLKDLIAKVYPSNLVVGQAWQILDPHEAEEKKEKK